MCAHLLIATHNNINIIIIHADDSLSVCLFVRTIKPKRLKLQ